MKYLITRILHCIGLITIQDHKTIVKREANEYQTAWKDIKGLARRCNLNNSKIFLDHVFIIERKMDIGNR